MKIAFFLNTPAQVHLYKNVIAELERRGHETIILARRYGDTIPLLDEIGLAYIECSRPPSSKVGKIATFPGDVARAYNALKGSPPDLLLDAGIFGAYVSILLKRPCVVFSDSEPTPLQFALTLPIVEAVITPSSFRRNLGKKHVKVNSYKELAYLHPNHFRPNREVLGLLGVGPSERFVLLRFNSFDAVHDFRARGFSIEQKRRLVRSLSPYARIFISSEKPLPPDLERYALNTPKKSIHDILHFATLVVADTGTIVTEAACLGTPAVMLHPNARDYGNFVELEDRYGLIRTFGSDWREAIDAAVSLIRNPQTKAEWADKRQLLLRDKMDMTEFMVGFIETRHSALRNASRRGHADDSHRSCSARNP